MRDKSIALDQDKSQFLYQIARAINAKNAVEVGISFGVSTIYLALAIGSNLSNRVRERVKSLQRKKNSATLSGHEKEAGEELVTKHIDLRVDNVPETLKTGIPMVDLVLLDSKLSTHFRPGNTLTVYSLGPLVHYLPLSCRIRG